MMSHTQMMMLPVLIFMAPHIPKAGAIAISVVLLVLGRLL